MKTLSDLHYGPVGCVYMQAAHSSEMEKEREAAKDSIAAALQEERQKSKVSLLFISSCGKSLARHLEKGTIMLSS